MAARLDYPVGDTNSGALVQVSKMPPPDQMYPRLRDRFLLSSPASYLAADGKVFYASDADQNDLVTGQTSFANTTPTFLLRVPRGMTAIPLEMSLGQTGSVAGGAIDVIMEFDDTDRYASGGTAETIFNARTNTGANVPSGMELRSGATASAGYGVRRWGVTVGQDVSPAEGVSNELVWTPGSGFDFLVGPASWLIYTYAGTTGPTWLWTLKFAAFPTTEL